MVPEGHVVVFKELESRQRAGQPAKFECQKRVLFGRARRVPLLSEKVVEHDAPQTLLGHHGQIVAPQVVLLNVFAGIGERLCI